MKLSTACFVISAISLVGCSTPRVEVIRECPEFPTPTAAELEAVISIPADNPFWHWMDRIDKLKAKLENCNAG